MPDRRRPGGYAYNPAMQQHLTELTPDDEPNRKSTQQDGWEGDFGRSDDIPIVSAGVVGQNFNFDLAKTLVNITAEDERSEEVTITISPLLPIPGLLHRGVRILALIQFGSGGANAQVLIDVGSGIVLNIPCSFVRVNVFARCNGNPPANTIQVGSFASLRGPQNRGDNNATFADLVDASGGAASSLVPAFARRVELIRVVPATAGTILFLDSGNDTIGGFALAANQICPKVTIPKTTAKVNITGADVWTVIYHMDF